MGEVKRGGGGLKAQFGAKSKSVFVVAVFCCTTPNSDILFNMMKEVTLQKKKWDGLSPGLPLALHSV